MSKEESIKKSLFEHHRWLFSTLTSCDAKKWFLEREIEWLKASLIRSEAEEKEIREKYAGHYDFIRRVKQEIKEIKDFLSFWENERKNLKP